MSQIINLTEGNFQTEVIESDLPVLVDYWAPWCGPCRILGPIVDEIAAELAGSVRVGKVNVDEEPELATQAGALGIPYVVLYRDGEAVATSVGAQPKARLEEALGLQAELERAA